MGVSSSPCVGPLLALLLVAPGGAVDLKERLSRHVGIWQGTYTHWSPEGELLERHQSRQVVELDGDRWSQTLTFTWSDGRTRTERYDATFVDGELRFDHPELFGETHVVSDTIVVFRAGWRSRPGLSVVETIVTVDDDYQTRSWQLFEKGRLARVVAIEEQRRSAPPDPGSQPAVVARGR